MLCNRFRKELDDEDGFEEVLFCCRLLVPVRDVVPVLPAVRDEEVLDELDEGLEEPPPCPVIKVCIES